MQNSFINSGDDCVSFKPGSTNILVQNLTCVNTAGIAIGSLGQYEGVFDLVENITAVDVTVSKQLIFQRLDKTLLTTSSLLAVETVLISRPTWGKGPTILPKAAGMARDRSVTSVSFFSCLKKEWWDS